MRAGLHLVLRSVPCLLLDRFPHQWLGWTRERFAYILSICPRYDPDYEAATDNEQAPPLCNEPSIAFPRNRRNKIKTTFAWPNYHSGSRTGSRALGEITAWENTAHVTAKIASSRPATYTTWSVWNLTRTRGTRGGKRISSFAERCIGVINRRELRAESTIYSKDRRHVNFNNLTQINISPEAKAVSPEQLKFCLWNVQSIRNKGKLTWLLLLEKCGEALRCASCFATLLSCSYKFPRASISQHSTLTRALFL